MVYEMVIKKLLDFIFIFLYDNDITPLGTRVLVFNSFFERFLNFLYL